MRWAPAVSWVKRFGGRSQTLRPSFGIAGGIRVANFATLLIVPAAYRPVGRLRVQQLIVSLALVREHCPLGGGLVVFWQVCQITGNSQRLIFRVQSDSIGDLFLCVTGQRPRAHMNCHPGMTKPPPEGEGSPRELAESASCYAALDLEAFHKIAAHRKIASKLPEIR